MPSGLLLAKDLGTDAQMGPWRLSFSLFQSTVFRNKSSMMGTTEETRGKSPAQMMIHLLENCNISSADDIEI